MLRRVLILSIFLFCFNAPAFAEIVEKRITYSAAGLNMHGTLAFDDSISEKRPGILIVHEWWGANEYVRTRARMLAELGYTALAVDMYGDGKVADHPDNAKEFSKQALKNFSQARQRFEAALGILKQQPSVNQHQVAAIGYCFGGGVVLNMARAGVPLDAVVSFHGSLAASEQAKTGDIKARVLVCHGEDDNFVSATDIKEFKDEMKAASIDYTFKSYPGAKHSFTNPDADGFASRFGLGVAYNQAADTASWKDMQEFLGATFATRRSKNHPDQ
jgi:dienelactone hydrolase